MRIADSNELEGAKPLAWICAALEALPQLSFVAMVAWSEERTSCSVGLASALVMPKFAREGPMARTTTVLATAPPMTKPPVITSLPVRTCPRGEMFDRCAELGGGPDPPQFPVARPRRLRCTPALA